jgi:hypothetical protein
LIRLLVTTTAQRIKWLFTLCERNTGRVGLSQLVRLLVVELTHPVLNTTFDICVVFMANYSFSESRRIRRQRVALDDRVREFQDQTDSVFQMCS